jgi:hypothetical protein
MILFWRGWGTTVALASFLIWVSTSYLVLHEGVLANERDNRREAVPSTVAGGFVLLAGIVLNLFFRLTPVPGSEPGDGEGATSLLPSERRELSGREAGASEETADRGASDLPSVSHSLYFIPIQFWCLAWWGLAAYRYFEIAGAWKVAVPVGLVLVGVGLFATVAEGNRVLRFRKASGGGAEQLPRRRIRPAHEIHDDDAAAVDAVGIQVVRTKASWLRRVFAVTTPDGTYEVEFNGRRTGEDSHPVLVDGRTQNMPYEPSRHGRRYRFRAGQTAGFIDIRTSPWMTLRSVRVCVGGRVLYSEWKGEVEIRRGK